MINMIITVIHNHFKNLRAGLRVFIQWLLSETAFQDGYNFQTGFNQEPQNSIYYLGQNHFNIGSTNLAIESVVHVHGRSEKIVV